MSGPADIEKYQQYLDKDIASREQALSQYTKFKAEYHQLKCTLRELPQETRYPAMIPAGPLAFFPGSLVHTNEILVLLGDNYFVERSAMQAAMIAKRREEFVITKIKETEKEIRQLNKRKNMGVRDELEEAQFNEDGERFVDIKEEVTDEHLRETLIEEIDEIDEQQQKALQGVRERAMKQTKVDRNKVGKDEQRLLDLLDQFDSDDDEEEEEEEDEEAEEEVDGDEDGDAFSDEDRMNAAQDDDDDDFNDPIRPPAHSDSDDSDDDDSDDFRMNIVERFSSPPSKTEPAAPKKSILKPRTPAGPDVKPSVAKMAQQGKSVKFDSTVVAHVPTSTDLLGIGDEDDEGEVKKVSGLIDAIRLSGCESGTPTPKIQVIDEERPQLKFVPNTAKARPPKASRPVKSAIVEREEVAEVTEDMVDEDMHSREISQAYARMRFAKMSAGKLDDAATIAEKVLENTPGIRFADRKQAVKDTDLEDGYSRIELPKDPVSAVERDPKPPA
ncbi:uri1, prefoldin-like chaperone, partial [Linderina pennispora]